VLKSDNTLFDENEMVFGKIAPGASKSYELTVKVLKSSLTRTDIIHADVTAQTPLKASAADLTLNIEGKARPLFAYTYQTIDDVQGNKDGQVQRGEKVRLLIKVKNIGQGAALKTEAILRNGPGQEGILIGAGRFDAKDLAPGAVKPISFVYEISPDFKGDEYQLELMVGDTILGESVTDKIKIKVARAAAPVQPEAGTATVSRTEALLRESPVEGALVIGKASKGTGFKVSGKLGAFTRVELEANRTAFATTADLQVGGSVQGTFQPVWQVTPPVLAVTAPTVVGTNSVHLRGVASDDHQIRDLYVRVGNRDSKLPPKKVFYQPNRGDKTKLSFEVDVPLWPGSNIIQVFARETNEVQTLQTLVVMQRTGAGLVKGPAATGPVKGLRPELP